MNYLAFFITKTKTETHVHALHTFQYKSHSWCQFFHTTFLWLELAVIVKEKSSVNIDSIDLCYYFFENTFMLIDELT